MDTQMTQENIEALAMTLPSIRLYTLADTKRHQEQQVIDEEDRKFRQETKSLIDSIYKLIDEQPYK
jgi:hypothetical protein